jgi:hypothetical protein
MLLLSICQVAQVECQFSKRTFEKNKEKGIAAMLTNFCSKSQNVFASRHSQPNPMAVASHQSEASYVCFTLRTKY